MHLRNGRSWNQGVISPGKYRCCQPCLRWKIDFRMCFTSCYMKLRFQHKLFSPVMFSLSCKGTTKVAIQSSLPVEVWEYIELISALAPLIACRLSHSKHQHSEDWNELCQIFLFVSQSSSCSFPSSLETGTSPWRRWSSWRIWWS